MRNTFAKMMTVSMVAGAALLVAACGGSEPAAENTATTELNAMEPMVDGTTNDVTAVDALGADANVVDANAIDANAVDANVAETNETNAM